MSEAKQKLSKPQSILGFFKKLNPTSELESYDAEVDTANTLSEKHQNLANKANHDAPDCTIKKDHFSANPTQQFNNLLDQSARVNGLIASNDPIIDIKECLQNTIDLTDTPSDMKAKSFFPLFNNSTRKASSEDFEIDELDSKVDMIERLSNDDILASTKSSNIFRRSHRIQVQDIAAKEKQKSPNVEDTTLPERPKRSSKSMQETCKATHSKQSIEVAIKEAEIFQEIVTKKELADHCKENALKKRKSSISKEEQEKKSIEAKELQLKQDAEARERRIQEQIFRTKLENDKLLRASSNGNSNSISSTTNNGFFAARTSSKLAALPVNTQLAIRDFGKEEPYPPLYEVGANREFKHALLSKQSERTLKARPRYLFDDAALEDKPIHDSYLSVSLDREYNYFNCNRAEFRGAFISYATLAYSCLQKTTDLKVTFDMSKFGSVEKNEFKGEEFATFSKWLSDWSLRLRTNNQSNSLDQGINEYDNDLCDSDEEFDCEINSSIGEDRGDLCNVFILEGPVASGKTSITHTFARNLGYGVIEMNASCCRSGVAIKKLMSEASQSRRVEVKAITEVDSLVEFSDSTNFNSAAQQSSSYSLILFDEVDIVLEEEESAFHSTIRNLAKSSKCPIVLTCSKTPRALWDLFSLESSTRRPTLEYCIAFIHQKLGISCDFSLINEFLAPLVCLSSCDLRACMSSLQLICSSELQLSLEQPKVSFGEYLFETNTDFALFDTAVAIIGTQAGYVSKPVGRKLFAPVVETVHPRLCNVNSLDSIENKADSLLHIRGKNFLQNNHFRSCGESSNFASVAVTIGGLPCPCKVLSDTLVSVDLYSHIHPGKRLVDMLGFGVKQVIVKIKIKTGQGTEDRFEVSLSNESTGNGSSWILLVDSLLQLDLGKALSLYGKSYSLLKASSESKQKTLGKASSSTKRSSSFKQKKRRRLIPNKAFAENSEAEMLINHKDDIDNRFSNISSDSELESSEEDNQENIVEKCSSNTTKTTQKQFESDSESQQGDREDASSVDLDSGKLIQKSENQLDKDDSYVASGVDCVEDIGASERFSSVEKDEMLKLLEQAEYLRQEEMSSSGTRIHMPVGLEYCDLDVPSVSISLSSSGDRMNDAKSLVDLTRISNCLSDLSASDALSSMLTRIDDRDFECPEIIECRSHLQVGSLYKSIRTTHFSTVPDIFPSNQSIDSPSSIQSSHSNILQHLQSPFLANRFEKDEFCSKINKILGHRDSPRICLESKVDSRAMLIDMIPMISKLGQLAAIAEIREAAELLSRGRRGRLQRHSHVALDKNRYLKQALYLDDQNVDLLSALFPSQDLRADTL